MRVTSTATVVCALLMSASAAAAPETPAPGAAKKAPAAPKAPAKAAAPTSGPAKDPKPAPASDPAPAAATPAAPTTTASADFASVKPEDMPTAVRMRRLEQKTQALKERAWQLKARVQMLKEQMIGGGAGAQALIAHTSEMGASFRLIKLVYTLDGTQVFVRTDETGETLYKSKSFDVFAGPIAPGNHNVQAIATYRGHGYGVFEYLSKYTFTARGTQGFIAGEGKISKVDCRAFEKGGPTTPLEKRAAVECKVIQLQPEKPADTVAPAPASGSGAPAAPTPPAMAPTTPPRQSGQ